MQTLIIVATLVVCSLAAPLENIKETTDLPRPSPINPDIPSDPKPNEKVTLINDANTHSLIQPKAEVRESAKLLGPYVPLSESLSRSKRAEKNSSESEEDSSEEDNSKKDQKPLKPLPFDDKPSTTAPSSSTAAISSDVTVLDASDPSTTTASINSRKPYSPHIHQHNEHLFKPTTDADSTTTAAPSSVIASSSHINDKRDIPVPLTRKNHHDDDEIEKKVESDDQADVPPPKEEVKQENEKDEDHKTAEPVAALAVHPATLAHPLPVSEFFGKPSSTKLHSLD